MILKAPFIASEEDNFRCFDTIVCTYLITSDAYFLGKQSIFSHLFLCAMYFYFLRCHQEIQHSVENCSNLKEIMQKIDSLSEILRQF